MRTPVWPKREVYESLPLKFAFNLLFYMLAQSFYLQRKKRHIYRYRLRSKLFRAANQLIISKRVQQNIRNE